jgi:hypothetical protein
MSASVRIVGPPRPPAGAGFFPLLEEELIANEVGDRGRGEGVGFGNLVLAWRRVASRLVTQRVEPLPLWCVETREKERETREGARIFFVF